MNDAARKLVLQATTKVGGKARTVNCCEQADARDADRPRYGFLALLAAIFFRVPILCLRRLTGNEFVMRRRVKILISGWPTIVAPAPTPEKVESPSRSRGSALTRCRPAEHISTVSTYHRMER